MKLYIYIYTIVENVIISLHVIILTTLSLSFGRSPGVYWLALI